MLSKLLDSLTFNIKQKTTNPFLGTLLIVWVFRNWNLIYAIFYFDEDMNMTSRLDWINSYFPYWYSFYVDLLYAVLESLFILMLTYLFLNISRYIVNIYENRVSPWVTQQTNPMGIIELSKYQKLETRTLRLEARIIEERQKRIDAETEVERLEARIADLNKISQREGTSREKGEVEKNDQNSIEKKNIDVLYDRIKKSEYYSAFKYIIESISAGEPLTIDWSALKYFATIGIVVKEEDKSRSLAGKGFYKFTQIGQKVKDRYINEDYG